MKQDEVLAGLAEILGRIAKLDPAEVRPEQTFAADLGIDSVTMVDVVVAAEDRFGVLLLDDDWSRFTSVGDAVGYIQQGAAIGPAGAALPARDEPRPGATRAGVLCVQPGAGLGVEVDPDKLARYRTDR